MAIAPAPAPVQARPATSPDAEARRLADRIATRLAGHRSTDALTARAVAVLVAAADPARAEVLAPRATDAAPLVERLAVWALRRADDTAVAHAHGLIDQAVRDV